MLMRWLVCISVALPNQKSVNLGRLTAEGGEAAAEDLFQFHSFAFDETDKGRLLVGVGISKLILCTSLLTFGWLAPSSPSNRTKSIAFYYTN